MGSFANGTIVNNLGIKLSAADRVFMKNIISGIQDNKGEAWCVCGRHMLVYYLPH
jgi:hypothetical protein